MPQDQTLKAGEMVSRPAFAKLSAEDQYYLLTNDPWFDGLPPDSQAKYLKAARDRFGGIGARQTVSTPPELSPDIMRRVTGSLPYLGGAVGGMLASPGIVTSVGGAALGGAAGESLKELLNRSMGLDSPQTSGEAAKDIGEAGAGMGAAEAGGMVVGKMAGPALRAIASTKAGTAMARLIERLPATIEGEPASNMVSRVFSKLGVKGTEPAADIAKSVASESAKITAEEDALLSQAKGGTEIRKLPANTSSVAQALRSKITPSLQQLDSRTADAIESRAQAYEKAKLTLGDLKETLGRLNRKAAAVYARPDIEQALASNDPALAALRDETNAVRNAYYDQLSKETGRDLRELKRTQSDMIEMQKALVRPVSSEAKKAAEERAHPVLGPKGSVRRQALKYAGRGAAIAGGATSIYELMKNIL